MHKVYIYKALHFLIEFCDSYFFQFMSLSRVWCQRESAVDGYDLCKSSADLVLTSCSGQRNELISSSVIVYVYYVKCVVCE